MALQFPPGRILYAFLIIIGGVTISVIIKPNSPFSRLFRVKVADTEARVIVGPYPEEEDIRTLRKAGVTTLVSLLDPAQPHEKELLDREKMLAERYELRLLNFPLTSVGGAAIGANYNANADQAVRAIGLEAGKVYLHCYLGLHRARAVADRLNAGGIATSRYLLRESQRGELARLLDSAEADFDAGRYEQALATLKTIKYADARARALQGWCLYRLGDLDAAQAVFQDLARNPANVDAYCGLGYCALRHADLPEAGRNFKHALEVSARDPGALAGLGMVRYREHNDAEACRYLQAASKLNPDDAEAHHLLAKLHCR